MSDEKDDIVIIEDTTPSTPNRKPLIIAATVAAVLLLALVGYWFMRGNSEAGKPVSAPRTVSFDDSSTAPAAVTGEQTLTIQPGQAERIGLKVETAGETLSSEAAAIAATGVVQANAYKETPVITLLGGVIRSVSVELGQNVAKGQAVAVVYSDELAEAQSKYLALRTEAQAAQQNYDRAARMVKISPASNSEVDQALAAFKKTSADLTEHHQHHMRSEKLLAIGAESREEHEQAESKLKTAEADFEEAKKRYDRAVSVADINPVARGEFEAAAVRRQTAESELAAAGQKLQLYGLSAARVQSLRSPSQITSEIALTAPVAGTVTKRDVNAGEPVEANKELLRVTDLANVWVIAQVYEKDLGGLQAGSGASVTTDAFPGRLFRGHVTYIDPSINPETRTAQVRVELDNPGRILKIGMYVNAAFGTGGMAERTVPAIPIAALQNIGDRKAVFIPTDRPDVFTVRYVRSGTESNGRVPILEGLNVGDRVVTDGSFLLRAELAKQGQTK